MTAINFPFRLGRPSDIAISDGGGIRLVTGGVVSHIYMACDMNGARIVHVSDDIESILAVGNSTEITETYSRLSSELLGRRRKTELCLTTALVTAAVAVTLMLGLVSSMQKDKEEAVAAALARSATVSAPLRPILVPETPAVAPVPAIQPGMNGGIPRQPSIEEMREALRRAAGQNDRVQPKAAPAVPSAGAATLTPSQANALAEGLAGLKAGTKILPRPDFLKLPPADGTLESAPTPAPAQVPAPKPDADKRESSPGKASADEKSTPKEEASLDLDAVTAALDQAGKDAAATMHSEERPAASASKGDAAPTEATSKPVTTPTAPVSSTPAVQAAPKTPETTSDAAPAQKPVTVPKEASPSEPAAEKNSAANPAKAIDRQALSAAVGKVVKGMTQEQAMGIVGQLDKLDGGEITEDMLAGLPHEVAAMLKDAGLVTPTTDTEDSPGGVPYRIIRLPEKILEKHRGKDGIASIPGRDTWTATGNFVRLPLPGGGDIKSPDHFKSWGLSP